MNSVLFCIFLPVVLSLLTGMAANHNERLPNVIFIYADDLGRVMLSHYGQ